MKETYYFSHDYNARNDEKIIKLIQKEGWEAYGIYWAVVEKIYEAGGYIDEDYECIAYDLRFECERITKIIRGYNLFTVASKKITSDSILARLRKRKGISEANRQNARKRWDKTKTGDATATPKLINMQSKFLINTLITKTMETSQKFNQKAYQILTSCVGGFPCQVV
jgi:hypothetical protein